VARGVAAAVEGGSGGGGLAAGREGEGRAGADDSPVMSGASGPVHPVLLPLPTQRHPSGERVEED